MTTHVFHSARKVSKNQHKDNEVAQFVREEMTLYDRATTLRVLRAAFSFVGRAQLECITAPTLVLVGSSNKLTHAQARLIQTSIPDARLEVIPQAHHLLNLDNPGMFNQAVLDFLVEA